MQEDIARIRSFNRTVTRRIGALHDNFLGRNRPLGESRLLYEIGADGTEVRAVRERLGLDSGYVSRLLRALEAQGLVETVPAPDDARVRTAHLTERGLSELEELNRCSDASARSILAPLGDKQRRRLVSAMAEVERLMRASDITIAPEPADSLVAQRCLCKYLREIDERFEGGYEPAKGQPAKSKDFMPPKGVFIVARTPAEPVGCGALRCCGSGIGEIKRLWVAKTARGLGVGQRLLAELESHAHGFGLDRLRLDTNKALTEARALYLKNGYREVPPFNDDPYPDYRFEKRLGAREIGKS